MYPAVEKDAGLSWIHISRCAIPVTLPGWAREGRRILASASRPPELAARIGTSRRQSAGSASSNDGQPASALLRDRDSSAHRTRASRRRKPIKSCRFVPMARE